MSKELRTRMPLILSILLAVALVAGCGTAPAPERDPGPPPTPAAVEPEGAGAVEPPPIGGDIIADPNGWSMGGNALGSDTTNTTAIPSGFTGGLSQISFVAGPNRTGQLVSSVTIDFTSGASMQVATGDSGNWQCKASGATSYTACTTQEGNSIGSAWNPSGATIKVGGQSTTMGTGVSITFK